MNPLTGILRCISLTYFVFRFSLLGREENLDIYRFIEYFTPDYSKNQWGNRGSKLKVG
jgi:hypothetical protein